MIRKRRIPEDAVALRHHRASPPAYHRILARVLETHGARAAIHLIPRLCAIALGADRRAR